MFKLEQYKILAASLLTASVLSTAAQANDAAYSGLWNAKEDISGGVYYPIQDGQTGPYKVNKQVYKDSDIAKGEDGLNVSYNNGRVPTANEIKAWDKDIDGLNRGLPEGSGYVDEGEVLYEAQCMMCHGDF
ncbi:MAG: hypothetical protein U9O83_01855, partial [Campylobacterota bacterium]|nr:hypothetical protein [Campylobacterota bacterium]